MRLRLNDFMAYSRRIGISLVDILYFAKYYSDPPRNFTTHHVIMVHTRVMCGGGAMTSPVMRYPATADSVQVTIPVLVTKPTGARSRSAREAGRDWTVLEHILESVRETGASPILAFQVALDAIDLLGLRACAGAAFGSLSDGERDRVAIARMMVADRPLSGGEASHARGTLQRLTDLEA